MSVTQKIRLINEKMVTEARSDAKDLSLRAGDSVSVDYEVRDGASKRVATFKGVCTKVRNKGLLSYFVLRKITKGIGVEKTILPHSPLVVGIKVERRGKVRRAVLNYLRHIRGSIRIKERFVRSQHSKAEVKATPSK